MNASLTNFKRLHTVRNLSRIFSDIQYTCSGWKDELFYDLNATSCLKFSASIAAVSPSPI